ncbi:hypothetical protein ACLOJK_012185 [Asimina triloba]
MSPVFPFGSVPLKTYLPDGDIDLTALSYKTADEALAKSVLSVLEREEQNEAAEFEVKDIRYIKAEPPAEWIMALTIVKAYFVQIIKCVVQNIIVDISFNQLGGLRTLYFLEQVDHLIGKDHLFKRSIMLIKAWCYYESRILGAHHNLISTYALETMVLYIFNRFHLSLHGPLGVLYRFLDYFSKFDWDNYCLSINGPVCVASLPEIVGNFYRIRSAFTYGARMLGQILLLPGESILGELIKFFTNTLERHQSRQRPDAHGSCPCYKDIMLFGCKRSDIDPIEEEVISESFSVHPVAQSVEATGFARVNGMVTQLKRQVNLGDEPQIGDEVGLARSATAATTKCGENTIYLVFVSLTHSKETGSLLLESNYHPKTMSPRMDNGYASSKEGDLMGNTGSSKASNQLSDLCSSYDSDFKSLFYGKCYHDHILCNPVVSTPPLMPSQLHSKSSKNTLHQSALETKGFTTLERQCSWPQTVLSSFQILFQGPSLYMQHFQVKGNAKAARDRDILPHHVSRWLPRPHINGGICTTPVVMSTPDRDSLKPPCVPVSEVRDFCGNGKGKHSGPPEFIPAGRQNRRTFPFSNSIELSSIDRFKFRMSSTLCLSTATLEQRMQQDSGAEQHMECSGSLFQMPAMPSVEKERYGISVILL